MHKVIEILVKAGGKLFIYLSVIVALILLCNYLKESTSQGVTRLELVEEIDDLKSKINETQQEIEAKAKEVDASVKRINDLRVKLDAISSFWDFLPWVDTTEKEETQESIIEEEFKKRRAEEGKTTLEKKLESTQEELAGLEESLQKIDSSLPEKIKKAVKQALKILLGLCLSWLLFKVVGYYIIGPLFYRFPPVVLSFETAANGMVTGKSSPSLTYKLGRNECMLIHEKYVQANREGIEKKTRYLFSWKYPFMSICASLCLMVEYYYSSRLDKSIDEKNVTISNQEDATEEVSIVELKEGEELVFKPSFLSGIIYERNNPPEIRSYWRFNHVFSWLTLRFRYLSIVGPVKLVIAAQRGIVCEEVGGNSLMAGNGLRVTPRQAIGFSANLKQRPIRSETFFLYLIGRLPLFDDHFSGNGKVICQQVLGRKKSGVGALGENIINAVRGFFGL